MIEIPENIDLLQLADLKARYETGLQSTDQTVRGWTCGKIASLDPYDNASMLEIADMLNDESDWVKLNAVGALRVFTAHASEAEKTRRSVQTDDVKLQERIESTVKNLQEAKTSSEERDAHAKILSDIAKFVDTRRDSK